MRYFLCDYTKELADYAELNYGITSVHKINADLGIEQIFQYKSNNALLRKEKSQRNTQILNLLTNQRLKQMEKELEKALQDLKEQEQKPTKEFSKEKVLECVKNITRLYGELKKFLPQFQFNERLIEHFTSIYPDKDYRLVPYFEKACELLETKDVIDGYPEQTEKLLSYKLKLVSTYEEHNRSADMQSSISAGTQATIGGSSPQLRSSGKNEEKQKIDEAIIAHIWGQIAILILKNNSENNRSSRVAKAVEALETSISHYVKKYGEEHAVIAAVIQQISKLYLDEKDIEQAYIFIDRAHKMMKKTAGQDSRETALCLVSLASIQNMRGNDTEAIIEQGKALQIFQKFHREKPHTDIADALTKLADFYELKLEHERAFELFEKALSMNRKLHGMENSAVAKSLLSIAKALSNLHSHDLAIKYAEAANHMLIQVSGEDSLEAADGIRQLAEIYCTGNQFKEGAECQKKVIIILKKNQPGNEESLIEMLCKYASTVEKFELFNEQIESLSEALRILQSVQIHQSDEDQPADIRVSTLTHNLAYLLCFHNQLEEAADLAGEALHQRIKLFGEISTHVASTYEILSRIEFLRKQLPLAVEYMEQAIRVYSILCEEQGAHTEWARLLDCLAEIQDEMSLPDQAIQSERQSLDMIQKLFSNQHPLYASGLINLSTFYLNQNKPETALEYALKGAQLLVVEYGDDDINLSDSYEILSKIYVQLGQMGQATEYQYKSLEINKRFMGETHSSVQQNMVNLAEIYQRSRRYRESNFIKQKIHNISRNAFCEQEIKVN